MSMQSENGSDRTRKRRVIYSAIFIGIASVIQGQVILPSESLLTKSTGQWHTAQDSFVQYEACVTETDFIYTEFAADSSLALASGYLQYSALMDVFESAGGNLWKRSEGWGMSDPCFSGWYGISCDCSGKVSTLYLIDNGLSGSMPESMSVLDHLTVVDIHSSSVDDAYSSTIPKNLISGQLNSLATLANLQVLDVSRNKVSDIGSTILSSNNLRVLSVVGNALQSLPAAIAHLTNLRIIELRDNTIRSEFPIDAICAMPDLLIANFANNSFTGNVYDPCLSELNPLVFDISTSTISGSNSNLLTGAIPSNLTLNWTNSADGYISTFYQTGISGNIASTCADSRYCRWYNFEGADDLAWSKPSDDVLEEIYLIVELARASSS